MMGWLRKQFGASRGQRLQLMFYNDNTFEFRWLPVKDASLAVMESEVIRQAWPLFHKLLLPFEGIGGIKKTSVLLACENDIILDPFNKLEPEEKPEKGASLVKKWVKDKAEAVRYRHQSKPGVSQTMSRVILFIGVALILELLVWAFVAVQNMYAGRGG